MRGAQKRTSRQADDTRRVVLWGWPKNDEQIVAALGEHGCEVVLPNSVEELLEVAARMEHDSVLLGGNGFEILTSLVSQLLTLAPEAVIVVLFDRPSEAELLAIIHAGAHGNVPVTIPPERLCFALEAALAGEPAFPRAMAATLVRELRSPGCIILPAGSGQGRSRDRVGAVRHHRRVQQRRALRRGALPPRDRHQQHANSPRRARHPAGPLPRSHGGDWRS